VKNNELYVIKSGGGRKRFRKMRKWRACKGTSYCTTYCTAVFQPLAPQAGVQLSSNDVRRVPLITLSCPDLNVPDDEIIGTG
jgi:hypothetical protein